MKLPKRRIPKINPHAREKQFQDMLHEHLRLADQRMKGTLEKMSPKTEKELVEIIRSSKKWLDAVNYERAKKGRPPLTWAQALKQFREM